MKLETAELKNIERLVAISKAAFDSDINVGASAPDAPPDYDSIPWHIQMKNDGHLLQAVIDGEIVGGAILFFHRANVRERHGAEWNGGAPFSFRRIQVFSGPFCVRKPVDN